MTTPALRLFAFFWWLLTLSIAAFIVWTLWQWWSQYQEVVAAHAVRAVNDLNFRAYLHFYRHQAFSRVVFALLPLPALVAIRWLATGRWRIGPRW